jgi:hypothetical protein
VDPIAAGLRLLLAAARDARQAAGGPSIQVELSTRHRFGRSCPRSTAGVGMMGRIENAEQSRRIAQAIARRLQDAAPRHDALIDALGPTGEVAAIDRLAWA